MSLANLFEELADKISDQKKKIKGLEYENACLKVEITNLRTALKEELDGSAND
jgi:regulator of replication initiation timing